MQVTDTKVLLNDVSNLGDGFIAFNFSFCKLGCGRIFAHDNTHHALYMAYAAVKCFDGKGYFDSDQWRTFRKVFETHVVED